MQKTLKKCKDARIAGLSICAALVLGIQGGEVWAQEPPSNTFFNRAAEGWFFYKDPKEVKPPEPEKPHVDKPVVPAPPAPPEPQKPEPFSVPWMREKIEILKNNAIAHPTEENAAAYMYAQRLMVDMSENFSAAGHRAAESDPFLNEEVRYPMAVNANRNTLWQISKAREAIIKELSSKTGIWFFFDSGCVHCVSEYPIVKLLESNFKFKVKYISEDGKPLLGMGEKEFVVDRGHGTFQQLGLKLTPAIALVSPPDKVMIIAHGAMALDDLQAKIVQAAIDKELVPQELTDLATLEKKGIVSASDVEHMKDSMKDTDDPKELVRMMQIAIGKRMN